MSDFCQNVKQGTFSHIAKQIFRSVLLRALREGCPKLWTICLELEDEFQTILHKYASPNTPLLQFLNFRPKNVEDAAQEEPLWARYVCCQRHIDYLQW